MLTRAYAGKHNPQHQPNTPDKDEPPGPVLVKDGADVDAAEKHKERIDGEDPADGTLVVVGQLVDGDVGLERRDGVHDAGGREQAAPAPEDDEPGGKAAFGVGFVAQERPRTATSAIEIGGISIHFRLLVIASCCWRCCSLRLYGRLALLYHEKLRVWVVVDTIPPL